MSVRRTISAMLIAAIVVQIFCVSNILPVSAKNPRAKKLDTPVRKQESVIDSVYNELVAQKKMEPILEEDITPTIPVPTSKLETIVEQTPIEIVSKQDDKKIEVKKVHEKKRIIVKYKDDNIAKFAPNIKGDKNGAKKQITNKAINRNPKLPKLRKKKEIQHKQIEVYELEDSSYFEDTIKELEKDSTIEYVQEDFPLTLFEYPKESLKQFDPQFAEQWGIKNVGQTIEGIAGVAGVDVNAPAVWNKTKGASEVVIGILDTGIDIYNEDLSEAIYVNTKEIPGNEIDDDNNGYIDDVKGWDFAGNNNTVYDSAADDKHGTHIAGIIAAQHNSKGVCGISPDVKLVPLKIISDGVAYTSDVLEAITYCEQMNVDIVNCSWGSMEENPLLRQAMENSGILFVTASGNYGENAIEVPIFPANYDLPNIISVGAVDNNGDIATFSNYGDNVHVAAPGVNIISTLPGNKYGMLSGTSVAAPFVTGIAAMVKSYDGNLSIGDIRDRIVDNVIVSEKLSGKVSSSGRVDALAAIENGVPEQVVDEHIPEVPVIPDYNFEQNGLRVSMPFVKADAGSIIEVPVMLESVPDAGVSCFNFTINYDKDVLSYLGSSQGTLNISNTDLGIYEGENGISILYLDNFLNNPIISSGNLVNLEFEVNDSVVNYNSPLGYNDNWSFAVFKDNSLDIYSQVEFKQGVVSDADYELYASESSVLSMEQPMMLAAYNEERVVGDIDENGVFNSVDFAKLRMYLLGKSVELPDGFEWAADVNGNGKVDSVDFANMRVRLLGMIELFPKERPTVPSNVKVALQTVSGIILEWDESTGLTDISHYEIYRDGAYYKDSTTNSFEDTGLTKNTTYIYELFAVDTKGRKSNKSNTTEVSFEGLGDVEPPSAPTNFKADWYAGVAASLTWDTPEDDTTIEGYEVYSGNTLLTFVKDTSVIYTGFTCNTSYTLTVKAVDVYGNRSADSNEVAFTTGSDDYGNSDTNTVFLKLGEENKISGVLEKKTDNDCFLFKPPANGMYRIKIINETADKEIIGFLYNPLLRQSFMSRYTSSDKFYYIKELLFSDTTHKLSVSYTNEILKDDGYSAKYDKYTIVVEQLLPDWTVEKISSDATEIEIGTEISGNISYGLFNSKSDYFKFNIPENGYYILEHTEGISSQICDSDNEFPSCKKEYTDENLKKYYFEEGDYYVRIYTEYNASEYTFKLYKAKPDFRIRRISPSVVLQGNSVALEAIVDNRGHEYIDGENTFRVGFVIDGVNTVYSDYCTQAIGENKEIVLSATADASLFSELGNHAVSAFIEKATDFKELDESNNTLDTEIFTDDYPDKKEESRIISVNESIEGSIGFSGDYDWLTFTPENGGYYRIVASCDEKISKEIEVCLGYSDSNSILLLGDLSAEKNSMSILRKFEENKTYYIRLNGAIGNYKLRIDHAKPDLDITQVSPVTILAGEETPFNVTVKNIGDIYLEANSFRVGIKLDDSEDIIWSSYNSKSLGVNSTITLSVEGCFYTVGEHTITVFVDYTNDLFDDNGAQGVSTSIYAEYLDLKLKVSNITPTHIGQDNPLQFTVSVTNSGDKSLRLGKPLKVILKDKNENILAYGESSSFTKGSSNSVLLDKGGTDGNGSVIFNEAGATEVVAYVETCEEDSSYQKEISVIEKPNLEILDITYSPESIGLNEKVLFKVNVGNKSSVNLNANLFRVGIKLDDSEDIIWSSYNSSLSANGSTTISVLGLFNTSGEHTVTAFIDYNSNISKEKETEGFSKTIFLRYPDLQVTNISPKCVIIGDSTQFTVDVINNESVLHTGQLLKVVLKDKDENILAYGEVDSFIDKGKSISVLLDKGGTDGNGNVVINELGITEIAACVDTENVIEESNEENNSYQTEINVVKKPDLKVLDITYSPVEVKEGEKVVFKAQVKNCSDGRVLPSNLKVNFKVDADTVIGSGIYDKEILPNETVEFTAVTTWTAILGEYNVTAIVDEENLVIETDDSNNSYSERMLVEKKPDLIVTDISYLPEVPKVADEIVFRATIKNIGEGSSPAGRVHRVGFKIDDSETLLWSDHFSWALEPGESITVDAIWGQNGSDKWTATEGIHTVTAEVNDTRLMEEADYANNSYSEIININSISMLNLYDDYDNDGIDNATEIELGTNLMSNDTDGDGISDSEELRILSNPILPDSDGDGILDGNEQKLGLNLFVADENKSVTRTCTTSDESVIVTAYGDLNIKTKPFKVIANDNTLLKSLEGVVGSPVDISIGNNDIESASITFKYNPDEINGMDENNLKIYWVDVENNMLVPVESHVDTTNKTVTCEVEHFSTYIMGEDLDTVFSKTDIVFTVDVSGSMSDSDPYGFRLKAISRFFSDMDILKFRIGIVEYNSTARIRHEISDDKDSLVSTFSSVSSNGDTNFEAGLRKSEELFKNSSDRNKVIVFLSDGQDWGNRTQALSTSTELYDEGINIYTIALGKGANVNLMQSIASAGGGTSFYIDSANQIENVYRQIIAMIDSRGYTSSYGSYQPGYVIMYDSTTEQQVVKVGDVQTKLNDGWTFYPRTGNEPKVTVKERDYTEITWTVENAKYKALKVTHCEKEELVQSSIIYEDGDFTTKSLTPNYLYRAEILDGSVVLDSEYVYTKVSFEDGNAVGWAKYNLDKLGYGGLKGLEDIFTEEKDAKFNAAVNNFIEAFNLVADYEEAGQDEDMLYNWIKIAANNLGAHRNIRLSADKRNLVNLSGEDLYIDFAAEFYELGAIPEVIDNFSICIAPSKLLLRGNVVDKYILMPRDELISTRKMGSPSVKLISPDSLAIYNEIDGITIKAEGKNCAYIYAYVNGKRFTVQEGNNLTCKFIPSAEGLYRIYVEGKNAPEAKGTTVRTKEITVLVRFTTESITRYSQLNFNGSNWVVLGDDSKLKPESEITVAMWIKPSSAQNSSATVISCEGEKLGYEIRQDGNETNRYVFSYWDVAGKEFITDSVALEPDCWQHIAVQKTKSGLDSYLWFYVNGERIGLGAQYGNIRYAKDSDVYLGANGPGSRNFKGSLDDVGIWNRELSKEEIQQIRNKGAASNTDGLVTIVKNNAISQSAEVKNRNLDFDGNYGVNLGATDRVISGKSMTVAMWVRPLSHKTSNANIISCEGNSSGYAIEQTGKLSSNYAFKYWNGEEWKNTKSIGLNAGAWQHIAVSVSEDGEISFILNGGEKIEYSYGEINWKDTQLYLGSEGYKGSMHQVGIWNRQLTLEEIAAVMENGPQAKPYGLTQVCQNSSSNFVKNEVEALEYILSDLSFDHLGSVSFPDENTISFTDGKLQKPDGSIYKYTFTFPIKARLLGGEYYATEAALRNSIASFLAKKSEEGVYLTEYELAGSEFLYNKACEPLYASMLYDTGDNITLEEFINVMGPQWEIEFANIPSEISIRELIHNLLDLAGMIPVVGAVFDAVNASIYFIEGDILNGSISMLGTIEFWGSCYALRIALKNGDSVSKIAAKKLSGCIGRLKSGAGNVLDDIASVERIGNSYEFVTADGIIFKMVDDDILYSTKSVIKAMANSTDELITCLKTKPEALFKLVKETKKLDDGILFKLVDDTEVKIFKSDLTADMHPALVGENGLLVTGDCTEEMVKAFDTAVKNAKVRGITDVGELIGTGKAAAESISSIKTLLKSAPERVFEKVKSVFKNGDELKITTPEGVEFSISRTQLKSELKAAGMSDDAAEAAIKCMENGCFSGDTLVTTASGLKRIDQIQEGEMVLAKDINTGTIDYKEVKHVYIKSTYEFVHLKLDNEEIRTTSSHLFFTDSGWWKAAENLKPGDRILNSKGELKTLLATNVETSQQPEKIYNLNVEDFHTYFVGSQGLLVHNDCTAEMMGAARDAISYAKKRDIADPRVLSDIGSTTAFSVQTAIKQGVTNSTELAKIGDEAATAITDTIRKVGPEVASRVQANAIDAHEYMQALEIVEFRSGENFVGNLVWDAPGIDGTLNGVNVSLKEYTGGSVAGVLTHASRAETSAKEVGYKAIDLYVNAKGVPTPNLIDYANTGNLGKITTQGTIKNIYVQSSGGWVKITNGIAELVQ